MIDFSGIRCSSLLGRALRLALRLIPDGTALPPVGGPLRVPGARADTLLAAGEVEAPDVIKIDVEGAEAEVLRGARRPWNAIR